MKFIYKVHCVATVSGVVSIGCEETDDGQIVFEARPTTLHVSSSSMPVPDPVDEAGKFNESLFKLLQKYATGALIDAAAQEMAGAFSGVRMDVEDRATQAKGDA